ncbi:MAG TPA: HIT domain-containing protein [Bacteroidota bacterium]|nr:HIT domain-containing protein [Bacteroidota bacterium]
MERLFSPWRSQYIASLSVPKNGRNDRCLFCDVAKEKSDSKNLILFRRRHCFAMMNLYPYNSGHVLIIPYTHTSEMGKLTKKEYAEVMSATSDIIRALTKAFQPHGFNFGANLGKVAGAGIDQHIHFHVVPRWNGDTNFMPTLADTKVVSEEINATYRKLKKQLSTKT